MLTKMKNWEENMLSFFLQRAKRMRIMPKSKKMDYSDAIYQSIAGLLVQGLY